MSTEPEEPNYVHRDIIFLLIGKHPHAGRKAHPVGMSRDSMTQKNVFGEVMYLLQPTDDDPSDVKRFCAEKKHMKMLKRGDP